MITSRIISIQIAAKPINIIIIQVYEPTSEYTDEDIELFYELIEDTIVKTPKKDFLVILGDWNAKAGGSDAHSIWSDSNGRFGHGSLNCRGERWEFSENHTFVLANTLFNHKFFRRTTRYSPNGIIHNQIDYILTPQIFKSST